MMKVGHGLVIGYEESLTDKQRIDEALERGWLTCYKKVVLYLNKISLIQKVRFVKK